MPRTLHTNDSKSQNSLRAQGIIAINTNLFLMRPTTAARGLLMEATKTNRPESVTWRLSAIPMPIPFGNSNSITVAVQPANN